MLDSPAGLLSKDSAPHEAAPPRIAPLATLPIFFLLDGQRVLVIGGSEAAAWKAELLAAAGAHVEVVASPEACASGMRQLLECHSGPGAVTLLAGPWQPEMLSRVVLAVADMEDAEEVSHFAAVASACGVPYNVIDKPAFCRFSFGGIVNRSPVVIGISTAGAAPIFGQAVRRRIEAVLAAALADWVARAAAIRGAVMARLAPGRPRRLFWERFAAEAFRSGREGFDPETIIAEIAGGANAVGKVTRLAVVPDDPDLLTLAAVRALQSADVIYFDAAISPAVLELARREACRIPLKVGAEAEMQALAHRGATVVRLEAQRERPCAGRGSATAQS